MKCKYRDVKQFVENLLFCNDKFKIHSFGFYVDMNDKIQMFCEFSNVREECVYNRRYKKIKIYDLNDLNLNDYDVDTLTEIFLDDIDWLLTKDN